MKKRNVFLKSLVAITLLSAMIVSAFLGTSNAEYLKTLKKKLDMEMTPDLDFAYRLYVNGASTTGVYKNTKNISQKFTKSSNDSDFLKIKVPVDEEGYYTISFNVDFWVEAKAGDSAVNSNGATDTNNKNYVRNLDTVVGCQMYSHKLRAGVAGAVDITNFFDSNDNVTVSAKNALSNYSYFYGTQVPYSSAQLLETKRQSYDGYYQGIYRWQTLTPTRAENVELSFYASGQDVKDGFMVWYWDFTGLKLGLNYELHLRDISIEKHDPREGLPYIEFGETKYVNNVKSVTTEGTTYPNRARGTYATTATFDKLVMQLNPLWDSTSKTASTPMSFSVPIKNVKANTSYKVYFDFSIALQEATTPYNYSSNYGNFFKTTNTANVNNGNNFYFKSYLHNGPVSVDTVAEHETAIKTVTNANKVQANKEMTDYSDLLDNWSGSTDPLKYTSVAVGDNLYLEVTTDPVRDAITIDSMTHAQALNYANTSIGCDKAVGTLGNAHNYGINWLNAIRHSEVNSETKIHWLTFYNTNFTFNVSNVTDLNWVWAIDGLVPTNWYRIKIDNVRIEEVVPYGSFQMKGMLNIEGVDCDDFGTAHYDTDTCGNFVRSTFRYSNGTGQNYRPRGYVDTAVNDNNVLSANNIFGAIYDAGDIYISNEKSAYDENEPLGDYTIGLRGYTAVKGGVNKYVWSVDGGKTWHDMAYEETLSNHTGEGDKVYGESLRAPWLSTVGEPSMITQICESFVDQGFIGLKDYSGKINRGDELEDQTQGDSIIYVMDTIVDIVDGDKKHEYSVDNPDATGDFVDFLYGVDDINSVYIYMQADLSEYKDHFNLDVVFAAVPNGNPDARCEILRIINYNPMPNYRTVTNDIESDITIMASSTSPASNLSAHCRANQTDLGHENKNGFHIMSGVILDDNYGYSNSDGYSQLADSFYNYEDVRCLFYDFPIMKTLKVRGYAIIEGGAEGYCWSVDFGRTWTDCAVTASKSGDIDTAAQRKYWYDGVNKKTESDTTVDFGDKTYFSKTDQGLTADLSAYIGQTVDVIFAAKSKLGGPPCPVARIDNVAVYGDNGTFYTKIHDVILDRDDPHAQRPIMDTSHVNGGKLNYSDRWGLACNDESYTIFEPYNVDVVNTRLYNNEINEMKIGGKVTIDGYVMCHGGVKQYKYSLDGGTTWTPISDTGLDISSTHAMTTESKISDVSFMADFNESNEFNDGDNGDFCCTTQGTTEMTNVVEPNHPLYGHALEFNVPDNLTDGLVGNLLVAAESNYGKLVPVLNIKLRFTADGGPKTQYNVNYSAIPDLAIKKTGFRFNNKAGETQNNYPNAELSVPKTYFTYGEPINISYNTANDSNPRIFITTNRIINYNGSLKYSDCYVKCASVSGTGTVNVNVSGYTQLQTDLQNYGGETDLTKWHTLPPGEYKIWMLNDAYPRVLTPYNTYVGTDGPGHGMITEPITIKVIDPNNLDFSLTYGAYAPYEGTYGADQGISNYNTTLSIEKNVFTVGEKIYFTTGLDYGGKHILLSKAEEFNLSSDKEYTKGAYDETYKGKYWQYSEHGQKNTGTENSLDTTGLAPGQYKLYYMYGRYVQQALRGDVPNMDQHEPTAAKIYAIIDITILPADTKIQSTITYTRTDGTSNTVSCPSLSPSGTIKSTTVTNGRVKNIFDLRFTFDQPIYDVKIANDIVVNTDIVSGGEKKKLYLTRVRQTVT